MGVWDWLKRLIRVRDPVVFQGIALIAAILTLGVVAIHGPDNKVATAVISALSVVSAVLVIGVVMSTPSSSERVRRLQLEELKALIKEKESFLYPSKAED